MADTPGSSFPTTNWSEIGRLESPEFTTAMAGLCQQYWYPIYVFVRRRCGDLHRAEDLTQAFFAKVLAKQTFRAADPTSHYRSLHSWSTIFGIGVLPVIGVLCFSALPRTAFAVWAAAIATIIYSVRIKKHQIFDAEYKGHTIRLDNSGTFAEKLYLDDGLVQTGGLGTKMEFRFPIKAGEGIGDEIIVWCDAGFSTIRCRIEVESRG